MAKAKKLPSGSWRVRVFDGRKADGKPLHVNSEGFVKEFGGDRLISHNDAYDDIMLHDYDMLMCFGKVIGVAEVI